MAWKPLHILLEIGWRRLGSTVDLVPTTDVPENGSELIANA
jgi:hypothetical protein